MPAWNPKANDIFLNALEISTPEGRRAFIEQACGGDAELRGQVDSLIAASQKAGSFLEYPAPAIDDGVGATINQLPLEKPGTQIGPYKLLQQIGEGGMGVVYMAEQTKPVERRVALKIIKPGMDTRQVIARFEAERQALAMMDHPNIAKVFEAGTTESGRPYFVMELVKGVPITRYCDEKHLSLKERLELMIPVCQAIQHAHQKGIIHRDIKPTNVLVAQYDGRPVPKVIDFGVAKATAQKLTERTMFTELGQIIGTVEYMSPEQAELNQLDIDTRSDIYSLGVLLYELLAGTTPFDRQKLRSAAFHEMLRIIREEEPPKPSVSLSTSGTLASISANRQTDPARLSKAVRGELDWIVMKALEKDRNRRYETANGFAADVQRYLNDEPVQACPPSAAYRFRKFAGRNRVAIIMAAVVSAALVLGTVVSIWQAILARLARGEAEVAQREEVAQRTVAERRRTEADEQRNEAESQRKQAEDARKEAVANLQKAREAVDQMLTRVADDKLTDVPQMEPVRKALLEDALKFYQGFTQQKSADPSLRLEMGNAWRRVGSIYNYFEQHVESERALRESVKVLEELIVDFPSEPDYQAALAESYMTLGDELSYGFNRYQDAEPILRRASAVLEKLAAERPENSHHGERLARLYASIAGAQAGLGRTRDAAETSRRSLAFYENHADQFPVALAYALDNLARLLARTNIPEAETLHRRALPILEKALVEYPNSQGNRFHAAWNQYSLANLLRKSGRLREAEDTYRQAIGRCEGVVTDFPNRLNYRIALCTWQVELGELLEATNHPNEAEQAYRLAWASGTDKIRPEVQPPLHWFGLLTRCQSRLVRLFTATGRTQEVEAQYRQALSFWEKLAAQSPDVPGYRVELALTNGLLGDFLADDNQPLASETARRQFREGMLRLESDDKARLSLANGLNNWAWNLVTSQDLKARNPSQAVQLAKKSVELAPKSRSFWNTLGVAQYRAEQWNDAVASLNKSMELGKGGNSFDFIVLAMAHHQLGNQAEAHECYDRAVARMEMNHADNEDLLRFRDEARELFGIQEDVKPNKD